MGECVTLWHRAEPNQWFHPAAFKGAIGQEVPVQVEGVPGAEVICTIRAAKVSEDGQWVELTLELPAPPPRIPLRQDLAIRGLSLGQSNSERP